jgi:hypothetical protein
MVSVTLADERESRSDTCRQGMGQANLMNIVQDDVSFFDWLYPRVAYSRLAQRLGCGLTVLNKLRSESAFEEEVKGCQSK